MASSSMEAVFGKGAESIGRHFTAAKNVGTKLTEKSLSFVNQLGQSGSAMTPYWRPLGIGTAAGIGLAMVLSTPPTTPSLAVPYVRPDMSGGGTGGQNVGLNVHPSSPPVGQPTISPMVGAGNSARINAPGHRVQIRGHSRGPVNTRGLQTDLQNAVGGNASVNSTVSDHRKSLTEQHITDILSKA